MKRLNSAYEVLGNVQKRAAYDQLRASRRPTEPARQQPDFGRRQQEQYRQRQGTGARHERPPRARPRPRRRRWPVALFILGYVVWIWGSDYFDRVPDNNLTPPATKSEAAQSRSQELPRASRTEPTIQAGGGGSVSARTPAGWLSSSYTPSVGGAIPVNPLTGRQARYLTPAQLARAQEEYRSANPLTDRQTRWPNDHVARQGSSRPAGVTYFTHGSPRDEVLRIQGRPDRVRKNELRGYEDWMYGLSRVRISTQTGKVIAWLNPVGHLNVRHVPSTASVRTPYYPPGSGLEASDKIQDMFNGVERYGYTGFEQLGSSGLNSSSLIPGLYEWRSLVGNAGATREPNANAFNSPYSGYGSYQDLYEEILGASGRLGPNGDPGFKDYGLSGFNSPTSPSNLYGWPKATESLNTLSSPTLDW